MVDAIRPWRLQHRRASVPSPAAGVLRGRGLDRTNAKRRALARPTFRAGSFFFCFPAGSPCGMLSRPTLLSLFAARPACKAVASAAEPDCGPAALSLWSARRPGLGVRLPNRDCASTLLAPYRPTMGRCGPRSGRRVGSRSTHMTPPASATSPLAVGLRHENNRGACSLVSLAPHRPRWGVPRGGRRGRVMTPSASAYLPQLRGEAMDA